MYEGTSRHHIIPYSDLRQFFNRALRSTDEGVRTKFKNFIQKLVNQALLRDVITAADIALLVEQGSISDMPIMRIPVLNLIITLHLENRPNMIRDRIHALYTWMPFLWFHGYDPRNRADDPQGGFEETAARIVDVGNRNLETLRTLHRSMRIFVNTGRTFDNAIHQMDAMIDESSRVDTDYGPFYPSDWMQVESLGDLCQFRVRPLHDRTELKKRESATGIYRNDDPFCSGTNATLMKHLADGSFYFDEQNNILWNASYLVAAHII